MNIKDRIKTLTIKINVVSLSRFILKIVRKYIMRKKKAKYSLGLIKDKEDSRDMLYKIRKYGLIPDSTNRMNISKFNTRYDQGNLGCYDDVTEVLTKDGWKFFKDVLDNDEIATLTKDKNIEYHKPINKISSQYNGDMFNIDKVGFSLCVTPNHNMYVNKWNQRNRKINSYSELIRADELGWYSSIPRTGIWKGKQDSEIKKFYILDNHLNIQKEIEADFDEWIWFMGIYMAEGCVSHHTSNSNYRIEIAAVVPRKRKIIEEHLNKLGLNFTSYKDRFIIYNKTLWHELEPIGQALTKRIPQFIKELPPEKINIFLDAFILGDGHRGKSLFLYTSSKLMADDLQELIFKSGKVANIFSRPQKTSYIKGRKITANTAYYLIVKNRTHVDIERKKIKKISYNGFVYCLEVPNHVMYVRRNGTSYWCGNSCVGHGVSEAYSYNLIRNNQKEFFPSRLFAYYIARDNKDEDTGASIRDAFKAINKYGLCSEETIPYVISKFAETPSDEAYKEALEHQSILYERLPNTKDAIKDAISQGYPVVYGKKIYSSFMSESVARTGFVPIPKRCEEEYGGHCMVIFDYDETGTIELNSWGTNWGNNGTCHVPWEFVLDDKKCFDFWTFYVVEGESKQ